MHDHLPEPRFGREGTFENQNPTKPRLTSRSRSPIRLSRPAARNNTSSSFALLRAQQPTYSFHFHECTSPHNLLTTSVVVLLPLNSFAMSDKPEQPEMDTSVVSIDDGAAEELEW
jgi:hypothetical protein